MTYSAEHANGDALTHRVVEQASARDARAIKTILIYGLDWSRNQNDRKHVKNIGTLKRFLTTTAIEMRKKT